MANEALSLLDLISDTTRAILGEYNAQGKQLPSLASASPGPFDLPEDTSFALARNLRIVEAACGQLVALLTPPAQSVINQGFGHVSSAAQRVVVSNKIADMLIDQPDGLHVSELSSKSGLDQGKLYRILRLLATKHVFTEVKPQVFANNRLSMKLVSTEPIAAYVTHAADESQKAFGYLNETVSNPEVASSVLPQDAAFQRAFGIPVFDFYSQNPLIGSRFNQAMVGWGELSGRAMLAKVYPWDSVKTDAMVVDIGGGNGHVMMALLDHHPKLKVVVQDLPTVVEEGKKLWEKKVPEALQTGRAALQPLNFFEQTPVEGADFYYLRQIMHDWPEMEARKILTNIRKAMNPGAKLLIHDLAPSPAVRVPDSPYDQAPEPLLGNFGLGKVRGYYVDMQMLVMLNSMERGLDEFTALVEPTGFKFENFYDNAEMSLIEFVAI